MTTFNYTSTAADPTLDEAFERALATAREGRSAPLPHLVAGEEHAAGEIVERTDPCDPARVISRAYTADDEIVAAAVRATRSAQPGWAATPLAPASSTALARRGRYATPKRHTRGEWRVDHLKGGQVAKGSPTPLP